MRRVALGLAAAVLTSGLLTACGGGDPSGAPSSSPSIGERPVTSDEADRLGAARYNDYKRGRAPIQLTVPDGDQVLTLTGRVDFRNHRALAALATDDATPSYGVMAWNLASYALYPTPSAVDPSKLGTAPTTGWQTPQDIRQTDPLAETLLVLLNLAQDRPDNAQLLRQAGAEWRGSATLDGTAVDLMTAKPAGADQTITYYVDATGTLLRVDLTIPGAQRPATIRILSGTVGAVPLVKVIGNPKVTEDGSLG